MPTSTPPADMDVWILAGQSNMEGVGELATALPPTDRVWSFTSAGHWDVAAEPLHRLWESFTTVHQDLMRPSLKEDRKGLSNAEMAKLVAAERTKGAGLGIAFGQAIATAVGRPVGLIPAAHGGTNLVQWSPGLKHKRGSSLYGALLERVTQSARRPAGLLWYQGESEGWDAASARTWGDRFIDWVSALRTDLDQPELPIAIVQISRTTLDSPSAVAWNIVQRAQWELPRRVKHLAVVSSIDLPLEDCIHLSSAGLIRLGKRLAKAVIALSAGSPGVAIGPRVAGALLIPKPPDSAFVDLSFTGVTGHWQVRDHIGGFDILNADGESHANNHVINAFAHPADATKIRVHLNVPLVAGESLAYGVGMRPYCNLVDEADMALGACVIRVDNVS